jgi:hypothetical protein
LASTISAKGGNLSAPLDALSEAKGAVSYADALVKALSAEA